MRGSLLILFGGLLVGVVQGTPFQDCTYPSSDIYELDTVDVDGCLRLPCRVPLGGYVNVTAVYDRMNNQYGTLQHEAVWLVNGIRIKTHVAPLTASGAKSIFSSEIRMNPDLVPIPGELYWRTYNSRKVEVLCFKVPILIVIPH